MHKLSYLLVLLSIIISNIYIADSYTLTASVLNQWGYNSQSTTISIYDDNIDSIDPNALNGFNNLNELIFTNKKFLTIDLEVFKAAVNLKVLRLFVPSLNKLTNSKNIKLPNLVIFCLSTNFTSLSKAMFSSAFPSIFAFSTGCFDFNRMEFPNNQIKTIDVHTFEDMSTLESLDLGRSLLTSFEYLQIPKNLKQLILSCNNMNYFALSRTMGVLEYFDISNNRFRSFKSMDFTFLANLTYLSLSNNPHAYPYEIAGHLKPLVKLTDVYLGNLSISSLDSNYFKSNTKLKKIFLADNKISSLDSKPFDGLNDLNTIWLNNNNLTKISSGTFSNPNLEGLGLSFNQISEMENSAIYGNPIMKVNLYGNKLTKISRAFSNVFDFIDLSYNLITEIDSLTLDGVTQINKLYFQNNYIQKIGTGSFNNIGGSLNYIDLSYNFLTKVESTTFAGQSQLETIILKNNFLSTIEPGTFANLPNLKNVDLSFNQLTQLDSSIFAGSNNLLTITLTGNSNLSTANLQSLCPPAATNCQVIN